MIIWLVFTCSLAIFNALPLPKFLLFFKTLAKLIESIFSLTNLKELSVEPSSISIISSAMLDFKTLFKEW